MSWSETQQRAAHLYISDVIGIQELEDGVNHVLVWGDGAVKIWVIPLITEVGITGCKTDLQLWAS